MNILALWEPGSYASGDIGLPSRTCEKARIVRRGSEESQQLG